VTRSNSSSAAMSARNSSSGMSSPAPAKRSAPLSGPDTHGRSGISRGCSAPRNAWWGAYATACSKFRSEARNFDCTSGSRGSSREGFEPCRARPGVCASTALAAVMTGSLMDWESIGFGGENRRFPNWGTQCAQRALEQLAAPRTLSIGAQGRIAGGIRDAARGHDPRRANSLGDRHEVAQDHRWNARPFQLFA
jgi:hypothetical protein